MNNKVQNTAKHVNSSREKTSIDERSFAQFIIALRQIRAIVPELRRTMPIMLRSDDDVRRQ